MFAYLLKVGGSALKLKFSYWNKKNKANKKIKILKTIGKIGKYIKFKKRLWKK